MPQSGWVYFWVLYSIPLVYIYIYIYISLCCYCLVTSVMSDSSRPHGLQPTRLLCPWDFPGKSTGVGCHCLLWSKGDQNRGIFLAQTTFPSLPCSFLWSCDWLLASGMGMGMRCATSNPQCSFPFCWLDAKKLRRDSEALGDSRAARGHETRFLVITS